MQHHSRSYHSYLVRFWEEGTPGNWRASAQHVQSGEVVRFAHAAELLAFLQTQLADEPSMPVSVINQASKENPNVASK
jgi:hypothetical protein